MRHAINILLRILFALAVVFVWLTFLFGCSPKKEVVRTEERTADTLHATRQTASATLTDTTASASTQTATQSGAVSVNETETTQTTFDTLGRIVMETRTRNKTIIGERTSTAADAQNHFRAYTKMMEEQHSDTTAAKATHQTGEEKTTTGQRFAISLWLWIILALLALLEAFRIINKIKK